MDGNPWGSAWAEPEKEVVQEVILKPKAADKWLTSPASGDIGAAWTSSSQWDAPTDSKSSWKPQATSFASESAPWESEFDARAADVLGGPENSISLQPTPVDAVFSEQHDVTSTPEASPKDQNADMEEQTVSTTAPDPLEEEEKPEFAAPFQVQEDEGLNTWRSLENAAIIVGDDGPGWETAWKPNVSEEDAGPESSGEDPPDDWAQAVQEKVLRDARVVRLFVWISKE